MSVEADSASNNTLYTAISKLDLKRDRMDKKKADTPIPDNRLSDETMNQTLNTTPGVSPKSFKFESYIGHNVIGGTAMGTTLAPNYPNLFMYRSETKMEDKVTKNADLKREREGTSFDPLEMTYFLYGGRDKVNRKHYIENLALADEELKTRQYYFQSIDERYSEGMRREKVLAKRLKELDLTDSKDVSTFTGIGLDSDGSPLALHRLAFVPFVLSQSTDEQLRKWKPLIDNYTMIGSYAQTELGHGSHIRGLETKAEYDPSTQEFVLNTPTLSSTKFWPGCLGKTSNHTLLLAQCYTKGKSVGLQAFLVPLRDIHTHEPLPGVTVGNIGPTVGGTLNDNGFLRLYNVRIPRENMLMKFARVEADGTFVKPPSERAVYAGMMTIRAGIPSGAAELVSMAATIATRYSLVRRQSELQPGAREPQVLDYQTQQDKLFPIIAMAYAFQFASRWIYQRLLVFQEEIKANNFKSALALHAASSCLKSYTTFESSCAVETCRLACGGHGYSMASGLPKLFNGASGLVTAEGEHTVLYLQCARYLMKAALNVQQGKELEATVAYLGESQGDGFRFSGDTDNAALLLAFQHRAKMVVQKAASRLEKLMQTGLDMHEAWNRTTVLLVDAAKAHAEVLVMSAFNQELTSSRIPSALLPALIPLLTVFGINKILVSSGQFIQDGWMTSSQLDFLKEKLFQLYSRIRPDAIGYVDGFDFRDRRLESVLGRYDGDVYENLYKWAKSAPLNQTEVHSSFEKYMKPLRQEMKSNL